MEPRRVNEQITVSGQIEAIDVADIAKAGFQSIICNRPDGEATDQTDYAVIAAEAERHGLRIQWQPVISGKVQDVEGVAFGEIVKSLPGPVFAYCRSGTRCIILWSLSQASSRPAEDIIADARAAGYDLSALTPRLQALARSGA
ncbi:MAG: TIGR01244 family sulfur transferase [Hyphomicrobiaceae bacterium]